MTRSIPTVALAVACASSIPAALAAQGKPLITPKDFGKWETMGASRLSPKGDWIAVPIARVSEENELRIRSVARDTTIVVPFGTGASFSPDDKWVAYAIGVAPKERERLTKEKKPVHNSFEARSLTSGTTISISDISAFSFSPDGRYIVLTRYPNEGKKTSELLLQDLSNNVRLTFSNVSDQAWADAGALLALTIDTDGGAGNAVQVYDAHSGTTRVLESSTSQYRGLAWRPKSTDLAALRSNVDKAFKDTANVLIAWKNVSGGTPAMVRLDPSMSSTGFPAGMRIADYRRPSWSKDGAVIYFGTQKRRAVADAIKKSEEKVSDVEIWHTNDVRMFPLQKTLESQDMRATLLAAWRVADNKVVPIGTDAESPTSILEGGRYATEIDTKPYAWGQKFGRDDEDVYVVDLNSGERKKILEKVRHYYGADPTGSKLAWNDGKDFWIVDLASGKKTNLTSSLTSSKKADFVDHEDDHPNNVASILNPAGWTKGGDAFLVYDTYDLWRLAVDGSGGKRITDGAKEGVVYRLVNFAPFNASADDRAFDLSKTQYLSARGKKTKQGGYAFLDVNAGVKGRILGDTAFGALARADSAQVIAFSRQRYDTPPALRVGSDFASAKTLIETNPQAKDYAWGRVEMFDFKSTIGVPLQSLLYYPANYDPSKKYPMIVYTYELLTQGLHNYIAPRENDYYNATVFTQNGYFVLMPDIVFRPREPGLGTQQSVEAAVKSVLNRGLVDPARVGHVGHSQGGYEAAFLGTHSKMFATTIVGSGITDMTSFAGQLHWQPGIAEFDHWETGQFRMQVAPWEDTKAMLDNSPLAMVDKMSVKAMLLEAGSDDGTVDPRQASLFYNYARRAGKDVVLLMYPGEGHGLAKKENQVDYERRILQWFGHYLKGDPAAPWIVNGETALERRAILDANKDGPAAPATPIRP